MTYINSILVNPNNLILETGDWYHDISVTISPSNADCKCVTWHSENPCVVTVSQELGYFYAASPGETTVYAIACDGSGVRGECHVTVKPKPHGNYLEFTCTHPSMCTDGVGDSHNCKHHQARTAYMNGVLNADIHRYIVIPGNTPNYGDLLGCVGVAIKDDGTYVFGVVGEVGNSKDTGILTEFSLKMVEDLGFYVTFNETKRTASVDPELPVTTYIFPGTEPENGWNPETLNEDVEAVARTYFY